MFMQTIRKQPNISNWQSYKLYYSNYPHIIIIILKTSDIIIEIKCINTHKYKKAKLVKK